MPNLEEIHDVQTLQQVASHLEKTVVRQTKEIARLEAEIARLRGQDVTPQMELELLKEQLAAMQRRLYAESSERRPSAASQHAKESKKPRTGHGPRSQPNLPVEVVSHTLPEEDRTCPFCGDHMVEMGDQVEESEEITVVEVSYKLVKHQRQKYRCRCNASVVTAPGPQKLTRGGRYSVEFATHVAEAKYLDHLPLERQARAMERRGLFTDSQTLWDQIRALAGPLWPTYEALIQKALEAEVVYADETRWRLMPNKKKGDKADAKGKAKRKGESENSRWYTWCVTNEDTAAYQIFKGRSHKEAEKVLNGYQGVVMTDGYSAYQTLSKARSEISLAHCWAHVRRKFIDAEDAYPELSEHAVGLIKKLFLVEREVPRPTADATDEERARLLELRHKLRQEKSREIVDDLKEWAFETRGSVLPQSNMGKAINYMFGFWEGLTRFLDNPRVPLDNNAAERALRGVVVGRKNHYGSRSKRGTEVAALFYTLFESAKLSGVDPYRYVLEAAKRAIANPDTVTLPRDII